MCEAPVAPFYYKGRVAMLGDAAHATTPYQGAGAGQAIEDALVLTHLLGTQVTTSEHISAAFTAYDQVHRPRSQKVIKTSREAGNLMGMRDEVAGSDIQRMQKNLETRMHWIWQRDLEAQNDWAAQLFQESL